MPELPVSAQQARADKILDLMMGLWKAAALKRLQKQLKAARTLLEPLKQASAAQQVFSKRFVL